MKKNFLFGLIAILLAGFGFGGVSLADNVASIGETGYDTLTAAVAAAEDGDTIILLKDVDSSLSLTNAKSITLDLNGRKITKNTTAISISAGTLTVQGNGFIDVTSKNANVFSVAGGKLIVKNGTFTGGGGVAVHGEGSEAIIEDGNFVGMRDGNSALIHAYNKGKVTIKTGYFKGEPDSKEKPQKVIYAGAASNLCNTYGSGSTEGSENNTNLVPGEIVVEGGTLIGRVSLSNLGKYEIKGGTFTLYQNKTAGVNCNYNNCDRDKQDPSSCTDMTGIESMLNEGYIGISKGINSDGGVYEVVAGYNVIFQNGENSTGVKVKLGEQVLVPADYPSEKGLIEGNYKFGGWFDGNTEFNFSTLINANLTLVAKWLTGYTVIFDTNGGTPNPENQTVYHEETLQEPTPAPTYTGYIFQGWLKDDSKYDFSTPVTESFTLAGKWEALSDSTGAVEDEEFTGVVLKPEEPELSSSEETAIEMAIASSNSTANMEGVVELKVYSDNDEDGILDEGEVELTGKVNFTIARLVRIPVTTTGNVYIKVRHNGENDYTINGLTLNSGDACSNGKATSAYNGESITPTSGYVEIYTCSASTFVAYTQTANPTQTSSTSAGGGGGSSKTSETKANTGSTVDTGTVKNEDNTTADIDTTSATEDLQKILDDGLTLELHQAYEFAFKNGITTMPSAAEADMFGSLDRIAMAKMLSQYAIKILGKTPDTAKEVPNFPDVDVQLDADYNNGVTLAYQLGIMGIGIEEFRPFDTVTRAEFATALSRMLFGIEDGENVYYETHMKKLMDEGIITVADPNLEELRGYVMIMLMRSANK